MTLRLTSSRSTALHRCLLGILIALATVTFSRAEEPAKVSICQLKKDPPAWNHKLVEISGFVTHASHNFTIFDPSCPSFPALWLEYGGTVSSVAKNSITLATATPCQVQLKPGEAVVVTYTGAPTAAKDQH